MKKRFTFLLCFLLVACTGFAQGTWFELASTGLTNKTEPGKAYVVLQFENVPKEELYKRMLVYLHKTYRSPKDVLSQVENESITVKGFAPNSVRRTNMHTFDMDYSFNLEFRDNQIKMTLPVFTITSYNYKPQQLLLVSNNAIDGSVLGIWNTGKKLKSPLAKSDIEAYYNQFATNLQQVGSEAPDKAW